MFYKQMIHGKFCLNTRKLIILTIAFLVLASVGYVTISSFMGSGVPVKPTALSSIGSEAESVIGASRHRKDAHLDNLESVVDGPVSEDGQIDVGASETDSVDDSTPVANSSPIQNAFSGESSIIEALKSMAYDGRIGYDSLVQNLALWEPLCSINSSRLIESGLVDDGDENQTEEDKVETFCRDFPSDFSGELDDFLSVQLIETSQGVNGWSRRLSSIEDFGADIALESAVNDLENALDLGNYAAVADIVWFLGFSGLLENRDRFIPGAFADPEVLIAVSSSLFCLSLGGCSGQHLVTWSLCLQFQERQCSNPDSIHHAVEQILTGHELDLFYRVHQAILARLGNTPGN